LRDGGGLGEGNEVIADDGFRSRTKHSDPTAVTVTLAFRDSRLELEIVDDGTPTSRPATTGQGIIAMRERAALLGGELEAGQREGGGFRVAARLPVGGNA
jgi:signal transduction histidine kinase